MTTTKTIENVELFTSHPLRKKRRPGPAGQDARPQAEMDIEAAAEILEQIEAGKLSKGPIDTPVGVPCDSSGKPLKRLTAEEEQSLALRIQTFGDVDARNTLVLGNIGLVHMVANQMRRPYLRYEDLVQEGMLGLLRATETFEPHRQIRFSTYCVYWIRAKIQRYLQRLDRDDVPSVAGAKMREDEEGKRSRPRSRKLSLSTPVDESGDRTLVDLIKSKEACPEAFAAQSEIGRHVEKELYKIVDELGDQRMLVIVKRRLLANEPETLAQIGKRLSLSREGARLLERKILKLARERLEALRM